MMKHNILYISYYFPPHCNTPSIRALELSTRLADYGYKLHVLSSFPLTRPVDNQLLRRINPQYIKNHSIIHLSHLFNLFEKYLQKISSRLDFIKFGFYFNWVPFALLEAIKIINKYKIKFIYSTGPPFNCFLLGYLLKKIFGIPLIIEYRDPWTHSPYVGKITEKSFRKSHNLEKKILKAADLIITISSALDSYLKERFEKTLKNKSIFHLPSGININNLSNFPLNRNKIKNITFTFLGTLYGLRDPIYLVKILSLARKKINLDSFSLKIKIFGDYNQPYFNSLISKYKLKEYFHLGGYLSREECLNEIISSTLPLHIGENYNYPTISFKVWEYLSMGKKILYFGRKDCYTAEFLEKHNLGYVIPINDTNLGAEKLVKLLKKISKGSLDLKVKKEFLKKYSWNQRVNKLVHIFRKLG